jgi:hypothetical protein
MRSKSFSRSCHSLVRIADFIKPCHKIFSCIHYLAEATYKQPLTFLKCRFRNYSYRTAGRTEESDRKLWMSMAQKMTMRKTVCSRAAPNESVVEEVCVTAVNRRVRNAQQEEGPEPVQQNQDQELDIVEEASVESFPASDPPAWIGGETWKKAAIRKAT